MFRSISIQKRLLAAFGLLAFMLAGLGLYNLNTCHKSVSGRIWLKPIYYPP
jgi:hypothetical protein